MLLKIPALLNQAQIEKINELAARSRFEDGKLTAGKVAKQVKTNLELKAEPDVMDLLARILMPTLAHHRLFKNAVLPHRVSDPIVARYLPGMTYGDHVDDPIMGSGQRFRTDVSMTIFLRDPDCYEGGELVIRTPFGEQQVKLPAGDAVIYPSMSVHRVAEVTSGERLVVLHWIQSLVKDPTQRELLYELSLAREHLMETAPQQDTTWHVDRSYVNLLRMWSEL